MFGVNQLVDLTKQALNKYNPKLLSVVTGESAINVWSDGGEWPQYHSRYDGLFNEVQSKPSKSINYRVCKTTEAIMDHLDYCEHLSLVCAVNIPFQTSLKLQCLQALVDRSQLKRIVLVVQSTTSATYMKKLLQEYDLNRFFSGDKHVPMSTAVQILSPTMLLDNYLHNGKVMYDTVVLDNSDYKTAMNGLFWKVLPLIALRPIFMSVFDADVHDACSAVANSAVECESQTVTTVSIGYDELSNGLSPNIVAGIPLSGCTNVSDSQYRIVPVVDANSRLSLYARPATRDENTSMAYWTLANGYRLTKRKTTITKPDVAYDKSDFYATLLWAIEVTTGLTTGKSDGARCVWRDMNYSSVSIEPISTLLGSNSTLYDACLHGTGSLTRDITWKLYYYTSILYTVFTYEQTHSLSSETTFVIRVGYVTKLEYTPICRVMILNRVDQSCLNMTVAMHTWMLSQYALIRLGDMCTGFDLRVGVSSFCEYTPCIINPDAKVWDTIGQMLSAQRYTEFQSIVSLWNTIVSSTPHPMNWNTIHRKFMSKFVKNRI